ncbi:ribokinase [Prolixibacter sp. SD074]|uniref:ribokinase n=1 Tax=Prolixibacter sp. SD074 TaxID=2652391 RepID=UPI00126E7D8B|nr:ribokinase [Prolixibacter sp. SD074]GET28869.1 ribokinase [Prolixibacter sp. SD074]
MGKILVIGSSNTDLIATVKSFPAAGETIVGTTFFQTMGGKGANQAVAAHRLGGDVKFNTCLGRDANGRNAFKYYSKEGLDVSSSLIVDDIPSGTAIILVDEKGENCIVVNPGANEKLTSEYIYEVEKDIANADMVVLQMEIPYDSVKAVCDIASKYKKKIILNVAPARKVEIDLLKKVDVLIVNETEAEVLTEEKIEDIGEEAIINKLLKKGVQNVILTLGNKGCLFKNGNDLLKIPAFRVNAVDTTAAGDTFCGALAAELSREKDWEEILKFATAASAICVTRMGAQPSIPMEREIQEFLKKNDELHIK